MKFAICNETFQGWDWQRTCSYVAEVGYEGIEIAPFTLNEDARAITPSERAEIRSVAENAGLEITGLHWLLVSPKGLSLTTLDDGLRSETTAYLIALVDLCVDLGGKTMVLGSPQQRRIPEGDTIDHATARFLKSVTPALERAGERGITICLEPLPPPEADLLLNLSTARSMIHRLQQPAAKTIFDVKSALSEARPLPDLIAENADIIAHVHANDGNRRGPGFGETNFRPIFAALKKIGYEGYVSVEVFDYTPDPETIATESLAYLKECLPS